MPPFQAVAVSSRRRTRLLQTELVSFRIRKHNPTAWFQVAPVVDDRRAQPQEPLQFIALIAIDGKDIKVDAILPHLAFWDGHKHKPRSALVGWTRDPVSVSGRRHLFDHISRDSAPKGRYRFRIMAVECHIQNCRIHDAKLHRFVEGSSGGGGYLPVVWCAGRPRSSLGSYYRPEGLGLG